MSAGVHKEREKNGYVVATPGGWGISGGCLKNMYCPAGPTQNHATGKVRFLGLYEYYI